MSEVKKHLKYLETENPSKIKEGIKFLSLQKENEEVKQELMERARNFYEYEDSSPLWSIVILDQMKDPEFIPLFLEVLDSDADFLVEASVEALIHLEREEPNSVIPRIFTFIFRRINYDPFFAKLAGYDVLRPFVKRPEVKEFLIQMFERDPLAQDFIASILEETKDKRMLELFKRGMEFAKQSDDKDTFREIKWSYFYLARGENPREDYTPLWDRGWEERWDPTFKDMNKTPQQRKKELEEFEKDMKKEISSKEHKRKLKQFEEYSIEPFSLEKYLQVRIKGPIEREFQRTLTLLGLDRKWTVEGVQTMINKTEEPSEVLDSLLKDFVFPSKQAMEIFINLFEKVWDVTPREELKGLTPQEEMIIKKDRTG